MQTQPLRVLSFQPRRCTEQGLQGHRRESRREHTPLCSQKFHTAVRFGCHIGLDTVLRGGRDDPDSDRGCKCCRRADPQRHSNGKEGRHALQDHCPQPGAPALQTGHRSRRDHAEESGGFQGRKALRHDIRSGTPTAKDGGFSPHDSRSCRNFRGRPSRAGCRSTQRMGAFSLTVRATPLRCALPCSWTTARLRCARSHDCADQRHEETPRTGHGRGLRCAADHPPGSCCGRACTRSRPGHSGCRNGRLPRQRACAGIGKTDTCPAGRQPCHTGGGSAAACISNCAGLGAQHGPASPCGLGRRSCLGRHSCLGNGAAKNYDCGNGLGRHTLRHWCGGAVARAAAGSRSGRTGALARLSYRRGIVASTKPVAACVRARPHSGWNADAHAGLARLSLSPRHEFPGGTHACTSSAKEPDSSATCAHLCNRAWVRGGKPRPFRIGRDHHDGREDICRKAPRNTCRSRNNNGTHDTAGHALASNGNPW